MRHLFNNSPTRLSPVICLLALAAGLTLAGCSKTLQEIPEAFTEGFEAAEFETFNSPAEENGLGNTPIWIEGIVGELTDVDMGVAGTSWHAMVTDNDDNAWLVIMDMEDLYPDADGKQKYSVVVGHTVCVTGVYLGYSVLVDAPGVVLVRLFDRESGDIITSVYGTARYGSGE